MANGWVSSGLRKRLYSEVIDGPRKVHHRVHAVPTRVQREAPVVKDLVERVLISPPEAGRVLDGERAQALSNRLVAHQLQVHQQDAGVEVRMPMDARALG